MQVRRWETCQCDGQRICAVQDACERYICSNPNVINIHSFIANLRYVIHGRKIIGVALLLTTRRALRPYEKLAIRNRYQRLLWLACYRGSETSHCTYISQRPSNLYVLGHVHCLGPVSTPRGCIDPSRPWGRGCTCVSFGFSLLIMSSNWPLLQGTMLLFMHELWPIGLRVHTICTLLKTQTITSQGYVRATCVYHGSSNSTFIQRQDEAVDTILEWLQMQQTRQLKSGIWNTGVRGKLWYGRWCTVWWRNFHPSLPASHR